MMTMIMTILIIDKQFYQDTSGILVTPISTEQAQPLSGQDVKKSSQKGGLLSKLPSSAVYAFPAFCYAVSNNLSMR